MEKSHSSTERPQLIIWFIKSVFSFEHFDMSKLTKVVDDDISRAATALLQLKEKECKTYVEYHSSNSAWETLFDKIKRELSFIKLYAQKTVHPAVPTKINVLIDKILNDAKRKTSNGYMTIILVVTNICNQFRNMLRLSLEEIISDATKSLQYAHLLTKIIQYVNKYKTHVCQQQLRYCNYYSKSFELNKFKSMLKNIRPSLQTVSPMQRSVMFRTIHANLVCIEETGLLSSHAFRHVEHTLEFECNVKLPTRSQSKFVNNNTVTKGK